MDDILIFDAVERMLNGSMSEQEKTYLLELRKNNPEIDQLVVEYTFFLQRIDNHGNLKEFKHNLAETETNLIEEGFLQPKPISGKAKVVSIWNKYKKVVAVAASIAGIVSVITVGISSLYNKTVNPDLVQLKGLVNDVKELKTANTEIKKNLNEVKSKLAPGTTVQATGTGFLIDTKGYMVTNAHVISKNGVIVVNNIDQEFIAKVCMVDNDRDIAVLKIDDKDYHIAKSLPYTFSKSVSIASQIFTLGYPKTEVVYGEGYLSSITGYKSDTLSYQIAIAADHGNSGGPVLNKNGDIIGVLTNKNNGSGAVFAIKSQYIFNAVQSLNEKPEFKNIKLSTSNSIKGLNRENQVKRINECVYLVKSY